MQGTWILITMLAVSSFPVIAVYIWFKFAKYPVSPVKFLITLLIGATAVFPALIFQALLSGYMPENNRAALFYEFFLRIAFTEELSRFLFLMIFFMIIGLLKIKDDNNLLSWKSVKTGTALGFVAGLGFAVLENTVYAAGNMSINLLLLRAVTAAPLHAACGSRIGAAAVMIRTNPVQSIFRFFTAVAIHGIYNLLLSFPGMTTPVFVIAILIAYSALVTAVLSIKGSWTESEP